MGEAKISREAEEWFDGARRVLFVHAHPDDETIVTGGTLAALAAVGRSPALVTLTRGERGEVVPGPFAPLQGTTGLGPHREAELAAACALLSIEDHAFLGRPPARAAGLEPRVYEDSGMEWGPDGWAVAAPDAPPSALTRAPAVEALNDLLALADEWGVDAVVSYDERGGYGHPDHVFAHRAARAVAHGLELPFWEVLAPEGAPGSSHDELVRASSEVHDVEPWIEQKLAALRAHATQVTVEGALDKTEIVHVGGQREPVGRIEGFRRR